MYFNLDLELFGQRVEKRVLSPPPPPKATGWTQREGAKHFDRGLCNSNIRPLEGSVDHRRPS